LGRRRRLTTTQAASSSRACSTGILDHLAEEHVVELRIVDVGDVGAETSAGLRGPRMSWSRRAWPTVSWIASGAASTIVFTALSEVLDPAEERALR
jgi:hypothetical protein